MTDRPGFPFRVGDRTLVDGRIAEVIEIFPEGHKLAGGVRVQFVTSPRERAVVRAAAIRWVGFGETSRGDE